MGFSGHQVRIHGDITVPDCTLTVLRLNQSTGGVMLRCSVTECLMVAPSMIWLVGASQCLRVKCWVLTFVVKLATC